MGENGLALVDTIANNWGPPALVAAFIILFFTGKITTKSMVEKLLTAKDEQLAAQKAYYEGRIADLTNGFTERMNEVRNSRDIQAAALQGSIDNVTKLIAQVDELQEIARVATPVIVAQREVAESQSG